MGQPIQIILMKQLAGYLSIPLFLVGPNGDLLFYNEPAEAILGRRFDENRSYVCEGVVLGFHARGFRGTPGPA